jgi:hypothetical protein
VDARAIVRQAYTRVEERRAVVRERLESQPPPPGMGEPSDAAFLEWWAAMMQQHPPIPMVIPVKLRGRDVLGPDGKPLTRVEVVSPLALAYSWKKDDGSDLVDGGRAVLERVDRLMSKGGL